MTFSADKLAEFHCTENYYKHWIPGYVFTDGVHYLCGEGNCMWLLDIAITHAQNYPNNHMIVAEFRSLGDGGIVSIEDGNDNILITQKLEFADAPMDNIVLWVIEGVVLLPSEY